MSSSSFTDRFIPKGPINLPLPVFDKGMVRNKASTVLPEGTVHLASNWNITEKGPTRRCGSIKFAGGAVVSYIPVRDTVSLFTTAGNQRIGIVDKRFLYLQSGSALYRQSYGTSAGTVRTSGANVRGNASTIFTAATLRAGDAVLIKPGASQQELLIASVVNKSHLTLTATPTLTYPSGTAYRAFKAFNYNASTFVDWARVDITTGNARVIFADGARPLWSWNGSQMAPYLASLTFIPKCVTFWMDRVFCGFTIEGTTYNRSRTRWSKTTDHTSFIASPDTQWQDRPYGPGAMLRLVPMGKLLIAYFEDRIDIGRPTNIAGDVLPVAYEGLDTGGSGLVGMRAIVPFYDSHFLMMDDGIKYFSPSTGVPTDIGNDIWKEATNGLKNFQGVIASVDWINDSILFGIPDVSGVINCLWSYNYKTKGWSRLEIPCTSVSTIYQTTAPTIDGTSGTIDAQTGTFDDFASAYRKQLAFTRDGAINLVDPAASQDFDGTNIAAVLETGDFSWQQPNDRKSVFALSLKIDRLAETAVTFMVEGSTNRGLTWKNLGNLVIASQDDENQVGFKLTGAMIRFRLTCSTNILPFTVTEIVLRARGRGRELRFGAAD